MTYSKAAPSTWKTLLLGGSLGFVLALMFVGREEPSSSVSRWLNEEGAASAGIIHSDEVVEQHSVDGGDEELYAVRTLLTD